MCGRNFRTNGVALRSVIQFDPLGHMGCHGNFTDLIGLKETLGLLSLV
jgi:hypothetical protein